MNEDIDTSFYERFLAVCEERRERVRGLLDSEFTPATLEAIQLELHAFAGEATLLGFNGLAKVANDLHRHLPNLGTTSTLAQELTGWFDHLTDAAKRAAHGARPGESAKDVKGLTSDLAKLKSPSDEPFAQRVLIIDDSEIIRGLLAAALQEHGHPVEVAENLMEFEQKLESFKPEVILTDINMPDIQGDEICRVLKQQYETEGIPIILFSSLPDEELARRAERAGADGYLSKEHGMERLVEMLDDLLSNILF